MSSDGDNGSCENENGFMGDLDGRLESGLAARAADMAGSPGATKP